MCQIFIFVKKSLISPTGIDPVMKILSNIFLFLVFCFFWTHLCYKPHYRYVALFAKLPSLKASTIWSFCQKTIENYVKFWRWDKRREVFPFWEKRDRAYEIFWTKEEDCVLQEGKQPPGGFFAACSSTGLRGRDTQSCSNPSWLGTFYLVWGHESCHWLIPRGLFSLAFDWLHFPIFPLSHPVHPETRVKCSYPGIFFLALIPLLRSFFSKGSSALRIIQVWYL